MVNTGSPQSFARKGCHTGSPQSFARKGCQYGVPSELCSQGVSVTWQFIADHLNDDVNFLALHAKQYPDVDIAFALRQIEGRQKARHKLPTLSAKPYWLFPQSLSVEQCSSEATALFKQQIVSSLLSASADSPTGSPQSFARKGCQLTSMVDLTGGFGIDCYFLSELFCRSVYVERQEELCRLARHNFSLSGREIEVVNADATDYAQSMQPATLIYLDPARRSKSGEKVFLIDDLEPNVKQLLPVLSQKGRLLMIKLSPMLDIQRLLSDLNGVSELFVVAVANEVKELLAVIDTASLKTTADSGDTGSPQSFARKGCQYDPTIHAVNLTSSGNHHFSFTLQQEKQARCEYATEVMTYIYEPDNALMKAGCYKLLSEKYGLFKLDPSSHLYTSIELCRDFQGRVFRVKGIADKKQLSGSKANILSRNYPLSAPQIKQKYKIKDDDDEYLIATRINGKPIMLSATKL